MIDAIANAEDFASCLVLERGSYTLSDRTAERSMSFTEQLVTLYQVDHLVIVRNRSPTGRQVLEALEYLHAQGITHGNLTPSHIVWSTTEFAWKLTGLECASKEGEAARHRGSRPCASPEVIQSKRRGKESMALGPAADMWSFGVIAFEVLTSASPMLDVSLQHESVLSGSSVIDAGAIREGIDRKLSLPAATIERSPQESPSAERKDRNRQATEAQNLRFVLSLLQENPDERRTATQAKHDALFRSVSIVSQKTNNRSMVSSRRFSASSESCICEQRRRTRRHSQII